MSWLSTLTLNIKNAANSGAIPTGEVHQLLNEITDLLIAHLWDPLPLQIRQDHPLPWIDEITQELLSEDRVRQWTWDKTLAEEPVSSADLPGIWHVNVDKSNLDAGVVGRRDTCIIDVLTPKEVQEFEKSTPTQKPT